MIAEGMESWIDIDRLSVNGFVDPLKRLPELIHTLFMLRTRMLAEKPACFVGVDFNFFNLLLEGMLKRGGLKTVHYVSPTIWAWRAGRIKNIARNVDLMLTLYPFETRVYEENGVGVRFVGHPKAHEIDLLSGIEDKPRARQRFDLGEADEVVAILPGSRGSEVGYSGPDFLRAASLMQEIKPGIKFLVPAANERRRIQIEKLASRLLPGPALRVIEGHSREVMTAADVVLVNSGTATLEAMLLKKPMVMSYRLGGLTYALVSRMVKTRFFALPNILAGRLLVPEFIQDSATPSSLSEAVLSMFDEAKQRQLRAEFDIIHRLLRIDSESEAADAILDLCGVNDVSA